MSESDELYAKALKYRDNHEPECSPEESRLKAEKLFLQLGQQGHAKAMHNYAVLQQKKGNFLLAAEWFDKAGLDASKRNIKAMKECGQIKEDIYLVVASDRSNAGNQGSPILDCVYGTGVDLSHTRSFNGNATTCDISRCALPSAKHIIADALTFDFAKKYNLKHVLIERLPTINPNEPMMGFGEGPIDLEERGESGHKGFESEAKVNFFGSVVQNLSKAMESGAILEIEWDPYTTLWHLNREESKEIHTLNPFHGFILNNAAVLGAYMHSAYLYPFTVPYRTRVSDTTNSDVVVFKIPHSPSFTASTLKNILLYANPAHSLLHDPVQCISSSRHTHPVICYQRAQSVGDLLINAKYEYDFPF